MSSANLRKRTLHLVPKPATKIDADMVAFTVMEHIDASFPAMWSAAPVGGRASIRNAIVQAVVVEATRGGTSA
ncbi:MULTISPECIES: hypothetical protein [unclassified Variovorax]|uniref:hypothetical protein n=1 Tax=unclassified Variovorax TaxID=663243 RepID=UPI003F4556E7